MGLDKRSIRAEHKTDHMKKPSESMQESELEFIASFPKENPYPVLRVDNNGLLMFANEASRVLLEAWDYESAKSIPRDIRDLAALALSIGKNLEKELSVDKLYYLAIFAPITRAGYVNIYAMDITSRKQVEEELLKTKGELEERVHSRTSQLRALAIKLTNAEHRERKRLAGIIHDNLQQLLVGAKWSAQRVQKKIKNKDLRESLNRTIELLEESIISSKSLVVELSPPILHESGLVAALKWLSRWMLEKYDLTISIDSEIEISPDLEGICILLFQSVRELLFNVIKHSQVKEAKISISRKDSRIQITVSDKGVGFDPASIADDYGFETGFGLFSIRERLDFMGGHITIDSSRGKGTSVFMVVPIPKSVTSKNKVPADIGLIPSTEKAKAPLTEYRDLKIRVLVADDHKIMREGLCGMLSSMPDIEIVGEASDGENAVEMAKRLHPDVVIMDVNMPRLNGIEATRRIKSEAAGVKVIGLSMFEEEERASAMLAAGAVDYLHKTGPSQDLIASIRTHCS